LITVKRHINGISLNGYEWLLNFDGTVKKFKTIKSAIRFLTKHNVSLQSVDIVFEHKKKKKGGKIG
jgi:hypothetical protein